jgi:hypothetical protein
MPACSASRARCAPDGDVKPDRAAPRPSAASALEPAAEADNAEPRRPAAQLQSEPTSPEFHLNRVPPFVEGELARLYGHLYSSLPFMRLFGTMDGVSTYVERHAGRISTILLFQKQGRRIIVRNEYLRLDQATLQRFSRHVLRVFSDVDVICLRHLDTDLRTLPFPFQRHECAEDYVLQLPPSVDEYTELMGKSTRRNIKRYSAKLAQDHPSFTLRFYTNEEIDADDVRTLLRMSEEKIVSKGKQFSVDPAFAKQMLILSRQCGFVAVATIEGRLCAGLVCFRNGTHFAAKVVAHDSAYDDYWLGTLCYYRTICEAITRGGTVFNLGIQRYDYKTRLLAVRRDLDRVTIYRSRWAQVRHAHCVAGMLAGRLVRQVKLHLQAREQSRLTRSVMTLLSMLRTIKARLLSTAG